MLSVSTREFLSHPIEDPKSKLIDHLLEVGKNSHKFFSETKFTNTSLAFYAGLLHDIGKINPWYQEVFHASVGNRDQAKKDALEKYVQEHARFSARAAYFVLRSSKLDDSTVEKIMVIIYGHHSKIRQKLGDIPKNYETHQELPNLGNLQNCKTNGKLQTTSNTWKNFKNIKSLSKLRRTSAT